MAYFATLYSGSTGNCTYIKEDDKFLLIDMGKNCKQTMLGLQTLEEKTDNLVGILLTHEHSDHISGLNVFLKKVSVPVYGSWGTLEAIKIKNKVPDFSTLKSIEAEKIDIEGFTVESFPTSHDSADCTGYRVTTPKGKVFAMATDLGFVSDTVFSKLSGADLVGLEANYDYNSLMMGRYPYDLKRRIASETGHLSNEDSVNTVIKLIETGCTKFAMCHLSEENNAPFLVKDAFTAGFNSNGINSDDILLQVCKRHSVSPIIEF